MRYALIIPAWNEAATLPDTLPKIQAAMAQVAPAGFEGALIVVNNNSTDATGEVAASLGAEVVFEPVNQIAKARNAGARRAADMGVEAMVFVDADSHPSAELLGAALGLLADEKAVGGGARLVMEPPPSLLFRLVLWLWNLFSGWRGLPAGCFVFCRRDAFEAAEGFPETVYASEEIWLGQKLRAWGRAEGRSLPMVIIQEPPMTTSSRKLDRPWLTGGRMLVFVFFPWAVRWKKFCGHWYVRE